METLNWLLDRWEEFLAQSEGADSVTLTLDWAEAEGHEADGATWKYYQYADEDFIRISEYNEGKCS